MKRIKSFLTIIMATIFALSLVPAGAWAQDADKHGEMYGDTNYDTSTGAGLGSITIANTKANETYNVYRIFDLASFSDSNTTPGVHADSTHQTSSAYDGEAYSYVIRQYTVDTGQTAATQNPWWTFLMGVSASDGTSAKYAAYKAKSTDSPAGTYDPSNADYEGAVAGQLFWIEPEAITLTDANGVSHGDYHVVTATKRFLNTFDVAATGTANGNPFPYDGQDYVEPAAAAQPIKVVQDFAQNALAYAQKQVSDGNGSTSDTIAPNYVEKESTRDTTITVNGTERTGGSDAAVFTGDDNPLKAGTQKVPLGWYLVGTTMGTLASLDTTNKDVTIYNKNQSPDLEKKVLRKGAAAPTGGLGSGDIDKLVRKTLKSWQDSDSSNAGKGYAEATAGAIDWVDNTDADVDDLVMFRTVINARQGVMDYRLHDVMEDGLEFYQGDALPSGYVTDENSTAATYNLRVFLVRGADTEAANDDGVWEVKSSDTITGVDGNKTNWTLKTRGGSPAADNDGCDFEIVFADATNSPNAVTTGDGDAAVRFACDDHVARDVKDGDRIVVLYWAKVLPEAVVYGTEDGTASGAANDKTTVWDNETAGEAAADRVQLKGDDGADYDQAYKATDSNNRNTNSTILTYGAKSHTEWRRSEVTTYQLDVVKTQDGSDSFDLLKGAKFRMYKATTDTLKGITLAGDANLNKAIGAGGMSVKAWDGDSWESATIYQEGKALGFEVVDGWTTVGEDDNGTSNVDDDDVAAQTVKSHRYKGDDWTASSANTQVLSSTASGGTTNILESTYDREISVHGLEEGWYILVEEEAPEGFNKLAHPIAIYVNGDMDSSHRLDYDGQNDSGDEGKLCVTSNPNNASVAASNGQTRTAWNATVTAPTLGAASEKNPYKYATATNGGVQVINQTGAELPSTGGIGTTIFYVAGTVLVVGAVVMLVAKRRMGTEA